MPRRKKVKLELLQCMSERKVSFRKRNTGLVKKLSELSTLCDVDVCDIILNPFHSSFDVWPSLPGVQSVLTKFRHIPEGEQTKHMYNLETFTQERIQKTREQVRKLRMENRRIEIEQIINQCMSGGSFDIKNNYNLLNDMDLVLKQDIQELFIRIKALKG
ncbi:MADS box transcription factor [Lithospermum erythrorhizon]|uniref:MADS box transcription factor n=1 Tax=Lithospermum erythrorhizon TaxID=34254 RepID=A0AAV3QYG3_LITER